MFPFALVFFPLNLAPTLALAPALARPVFLDPLGPTDSRQSYIDANASCCWLDCTSGIVLIGVETMEQSKRSSMGHYAAGDQLVGWRLVGIVDYGRQLRMRSFEREGRIH